jgi:hypothetical protein
MSLEVAAKHLAAHGRGPDDQLVHMSGKEVAGLQALAKAAGGSLTINPQTGLAEAGFLDDLLPTIVGAGLMYFSGGAINPLTAGAIVGGVETVRTGDVGKGFMAGLGGYGGAGMVGGLTGAGASAMNTQATNAIQTANPGLTASEIGREMGTAGFVQPNIAASANPALASNADKLMAGGSSFLTDPSVAGLGGYKTLGMAAAPAVMGAMQPKLNAEPDKTPQMVRPYSYNYNAQTPSNMIGSQYQPTGQDTSERQWFNPSYTALEPYQAANGGIIALAGGGPVEMMSNQAAMGTNTMYPMANMATSSFATPYQSPVSTNMLAPTSDSGVGMNGEPNMQGTRLAAGGLSDLGGYSDGGRLLRGPGDGVSDSIPAQIGNKQPARLADGEFVVPARIVSELGNGSTEAGAKQLYKMLDRVQNARGKTTGKNKVAKNTNAAKLLPA